MCSLVARLRKKSPCDCSCDSVLNALRLPLVCETHARLPAQFRSQVGAVAALATQVRTVGSAAGACLELLEGDWDDDDGT